MGRATRNSAYPGRVTRRRERREFDGAEHELRQLLREWDPIGVFDHIDPDGHAPDDEYDCLIPGLYSRLRNGAGENEVFAFLEHELVMHFGIRVHPHPDRSFAQYVVTWWRLRMGSALT